jgi:hypothetical protein
VFGGFQWARLVCSIDLLVEDDPLRAWRENLLDMFDGLARAATAGDI